MKAAWVILGIVIGISFYPIMSEAVEYYGKFPPTRAYDSASIENTTSQRINATSYSSPLILVSDDYITLEFVRVP